MKNRNKNSYNNSNKMESKIFSNVDGNNCIAELNIIQQKTSLISFY